jgi:hypothetical protein
MSIKEYAGILREEFKAHPAKSCMKTAAGIIFAAVGYPLIYEQAPSKERVREPEKISKTLLEIRACGMTYYLTKGPITQDDLRKMITEGLKQDSYFKDSSGKKRERDYPLWI